MEKELILEVGKRYLTRCGRVSGIIERHPMNDVHYPFWDNENTRSYTINGRYYPIGDSVKDLISEYKEPTKETVEVRKEFVMAAYKSACVEWKEKIKKELPELFKEKEFVKGRWYKRNSDGVIFCFNGKFDRDQDPMGYGFIDSGRELDLWCDSTSMGWSGDFKEADEETVESALIAEAKRRGLEVGVEMILPDGSKTSFKRRDKGMFLKDGTLYWHSVLYPIFENGKWAEPLKEQPKTELTIEQIAEKFGVKVENLRIKD